MSDKNDGFKVDAQGYGAGNYIKQVLHPKGLQRAITESVSPKYQERMETLREADKGMRETAGNLKAYLGSAQAAFKDNRYLDVAHWCSQIDAAVRTMIQEGKPVVDLRDAEIAEFYARYEDAEPDHDYFSSADDGLVSTAGIMDRLFGNSIEKLYWKKVKESKFAVQSLIKKAEKLIAIVLSSLGRMGDARAKGNIAGWIEDLQRMAKAQSEFQVFARGIYDKHLKQLADIVKANRPKPAVQTPDKSKAAPPAQIPAADKAEEAAELVEEKPVEVAPKREPGRPTVDEASKKKEMAQIEQLQNLLKNPVQPTVSDVPKVDEKPQAMIAGPDPVAPEVGATPEIKPIVEAPKSAPIAEVAAPIVPESPKVIDRPKAVPRVPSPVVNFESQEKVPTQVAPAVQSIPEPFTESAPDIKSTTIPSVAPSGRGRGRPRMYPVGQSPTDIKKRERLEKKNNPTSVPEPPIARSVENKLPMHDLDGTLTEEIKKHKSPMHDLDGTLSEDKGDDKVDLHKKTIEAPPADSDKKMTMVLLPKIKPDNLDVMQFRLMKELGHPVKFVTQYDGKEVAKEYIDAGWDVQGMNYKEAEVIEEKNKKNPLDMLDDPEFLASLPRLGNGSFNKQKLIGDDGQTLVGGKVVVVPSKYPDFQNLDPKMRKAVIDKLNKLEEDPANLIVPVKKEPKADKPTDVELPKEEKSPEVPEVNVQSPIEPKVEPLEDEITEDEKVSPLSEEEEDMAIYMHGDLLEKLLKKKIAQVSKSDIFNLLENPAYIKSLPRNKDKSFNIDLISKFPEFKIMQNAGMSKKYISVLHNKEAVERRTKAAGMHELFFSALQKVANAEDFGLMAAMMCAYSEEIEKYDPETSIRLIQAAEKLI